MTHGSKMMQNRQVTGCQDFLHSCQKGSVRIIEDGETKQAVKY